MPADRDTALLLEIARRIAASDGSVSEQEAQVLNELPARFGLQQVDEQGHERIASQSLQAMGAALTSHSDRCLAARLACLVAGASRNPGDLSAINRQERIAYRELVDALQLPTSELEEIEWSVRQELAQGHSILQLIGEALFGKGGWPDPSLMGPEIPGL